MIITCPYCNNSASFYFSYNDNFFRCDTCGLIFKENISEQDKLVYTLPMLNKGRKQNQRTYNIICEKMVSSVPDLRNMQEGIDIAGEYGDFAYCIKEETQMNMTVLDLLDIPQHKKYNGISYVRGEFPNNMFPQKIFDFVSLNHLIEHCTNLKEFVKKLMVYSKKYLFISTPDVRTLDIEHPERWKYLKNYPDHVLFINQDFISYLCKQYRCSASYTLFENKVYYTLLKLR